MFLGTYAFPIILSSQAYRPADELNCLTTFQSSLQPNFKNGRTGTEDEARKFLCRQEETDHADKSSQIVKHVDDLLIRFY